MKKILIVDDEPMMLKLADRALNKNYKTILASKASEAVDIACADKPDLMILDMKMPDMSGIELQKRIHEKSNEPIPFVYMTASVSEITDPSGQACEFIQKPIKPKMLLEKVKQILGE